MEECDEIRGWSEAHLWLVTIYRTKPITLAEHLIRARCSHLSPLGAGMEEFALFVLPCITVLSLICCCSISVHLYIYLSLCLCHVSNYHCISYLISQIRPQRRPWPHAVQQAPNQKQVHMMASFRNSYKQAAHDILSYWPCIKHIDYSRGFTGESGGPNAVLKAFPATKENNSGTKKQHLKILNLAQNVKNPKILMYVMAFLCVLSFCELVNSYISCYVMFCYMLSYCCNPFYQSEGVGMCWKQRTSVCVCVCVFTAASLFPAKSAVKLSAFVSCLTVYEEAMQRRSLTWN